MPHTTPSEIVRFSLKAAGILGVGQSALAEDYSDAFDTLNDMMAHWQKQRWLVYHLIDVWAATTGAVSYTVGPGMDFNTIRQDRIEAAFFRQTISAPPNQVDFPLEVLESREDYNQIRLKSLSTPLPRWIWFDPGWPTGTVYPWPIAPAGAGQVHISFKAPLGPFTSYTQDLNLPPEYREALWSNLTVRLAPIYQYEINSVVLRIANSSLAAIRSANAQIPRLRMPRFLSYRSRYDIYSDTLY